MRASGQPQMVGPPSRMGDQGYVPNSLALQPSVFLQHVHRRAQWLLVQRDYQSTEPDNRATSRLCTRPVRSATAEVVALLIPVARGASAHASPMLVRG